MSRQPVNQRPAFLVVVALALAALLLAVRGHGDPGRPAAREHQRVVGHGQVKFDGAGPEKWAQRARRARAQLAQTRRELRRERRILLSSPNVVEAINLSAATFGYGSTLWRKARCETGDTLDARARNRSSGAAGLFQFLGSTWQTTPYRVFSPWSPYANALAAGWMHANGRGSEWECR